MNDDTTEKYATRRFTHKIEVEEEEEWLTRLNGYGLQLWGYTHECSRLSLRAIDRIARRAPMILVFHDVSYIELPLNTGKIKAREASPAEREKVQRALGSNFRACNVVALVGTEKRTWLIEYGYLQILTEPEGAS